MLVTAFVNSFIITVASVAVMVVLAAMVGWVLQRRISRWSGFINFIVLSGLIVPPAVVPTIWVMQQLGIFKTLPGPGPDRSRVRYVVLRASLPRVRLHHPA